MPEERVTIEVRDGVADVRLNRPEKMNALDPAMFDAIREAAASVSADASIRAVVLSGAGRAFCAGLDFQSFQAMEGRPPRENTGDLLSKGPQTRANAAQSVAWAWREAPMPVIAAVHGVAFGGGLQIALGADIRFVAPDARLSIMEGRWGLVPDMAGTQLLRHVAREDFVKELTYTARIVQGVEAVEVGLATHVSEEPREAALALAREIAQKSPHAVRAQKALLNQSVELDAATGLALEASLQASLIGTPNQQEAVRANLEKRPATYQDPG
ncbi:MAG: Enoyl-CoA hydratase/carnithine racemase [Chloroflexi bacterium]|nr:MAG: Enoyl-CoA hydratase/carnithine racemase [Chloroflexota bacterium]